MTKENKRVILVTGASRGVGKGIAEGLAEPEDIIICAARSLKEGTKVHQFGFDIRSSLEETVYNINQKGALGVAYPIDFNSPEEILSLATFIKKEFGRLDLLVHAACQIHDDLVTPKPYWEKSLDLWSVMDVGLKSNYFLSHALTPLMIASKGRLIIQISSHGAMCYMHGPIYGAQKAAIDKMAFDMAYDLKPFDICSLSLWSGIVKDEKTQKVSEQNEEQYAEFLKGAASQVYAGMVINKIYKDPGLIKLSGKTLIIAESGEGYGVKDVDANSPKSDRDILGGPREFSEAVVY
ncbi:SDR family NAD(P)-dependent oxidoreductase [Gammaproteobacteria bacterium]|nr:SDR family NAD(P)-dependent oxidoreductase [Gammaproteobacteria bacterium]MDA9973643.1 SDR family NAD(P)-dependent oxidoreductase [Gammaproteobacteria bacterium]